MTLGRISQCKSQARNARELMLLEQSSALDSWGFGKKILTLSLPSVGLSLRCAPHCLLEIRSGIKCTRSCCSCLNQEDSSDVSPFSLLITKFSVPVGWLLSTHRCAPISPILKPNQKKTITLISTSSYPPISLIMFSAKHKVSYLHVNFSFFVNLLSVTDTMIFFKKRNKHKNCQPKTFKSDLRLHVRKYFTTGASGWLSR